MHRFDAYSSTSYSRGIRWLPSPEVCRMIRGLIRRIDRGDPNDVVLEFLSYFRNASLSEACQFSTYCIYRASFDTDCSFCLPCPKHRNGYGILAKYSKYFLFANSVDCERQRCPFNPLPFSSI